MSIVINKLLISDTKTFQPCIVKYFNNTRVGVNFKVNSVANFFSGHAECCIHIAHASRDTLSKMR